MLKTKVNLNLVAQEIKRAKKLHPGNFNSVHEGLSVLEEEVQELRDEIFFGKKRAQNKFADKLLDPKWSKEEGLKLHKKRIKEEAVQVAAMAIRIINELT
jgi:hypothetical protein